MKNVTAKIILALTILLLPSLSYGQQVEVPVYKDGDWWVFRYKIGDDPPEESRITYEKGKFKSDDVDLLESSVRITVPPKDPKRQWFNFPLVKGRKWNFQYSATSPVTGRFSWRDAEAEVVGPLPQPMKTPAGEFKVIEIRRTDTRSNVETKMTYFYSPKTKSVVKVTADVESRRGQRHIELELIKYSVR